MNPDKGILGDIPKPRPGGTLGGDALGNGLGLVAGWSVQVFLAHLSGAEAAGRETARRLGMILVGALALMAVLFAAAPVDQDTLDFAGRYGDAPFVLEYRLVFLAYFGLASGNVAWLSWRYAHVVNRPTLRLGLRLVALGGLASVSYVTHEGLYVVARRFGFGYPLPDPNAITQVLVFGPLLLALVPLVVLTAWARVELGDHTPTHVVAGAGLGAVVAAVIFTFLR